MLKFMMQLKYPTTELDAAIGWGVGVSLAKQRLRTCVEDDLLIMVENKRGRRYYSPTMYALSQMLEVS